MIKPPKLEKGATVAFLAPAGGIAALTPHRLERAQQWFEDQGYRVKVYPTARMNEAAHSSADAPTRATDLMDAFLDEDVRAIVSTTGGTTSNQLYEHLDFDAIREHPTIFCGYSDMTNLHVALYTQADMVSFYGPAVVTQFGEWPMPDAYTADHFFAAVGSDQPVGEISPSEQWTDDKTADWVKGTDTGYEREYRANPGYQWLREGSAQGTILGGCITSLMNSRGTKYHPSLEDAILLLETPEGADDFTKGRSLAHVEASLANLRNDGTYDAISGLVFGRGFGYSDEQHETLKQLISESVRGYDFPVLYGVDVGHTDPFATIPLGVAARIDSEQDEFSVLESGVR